MSYICYTHATSNPPRRSSVLEETENIHDYLDQAISSNWLKYDFGSCGLNEGGYGEKEFIRAVLDELDSTQGVITDENVMIAHNVPEWGYGSSTAYTTSQGTSCYGATVYAGYGVGDWETRVFTWHECAHAYVTGSEADDHEKGTYNLDWAGSMSDITPLCSGYLYDTWGEVDTVYEGSARPLPSSFCNGESNNQHVYAYSYKRDNHDWSKYSSCTIDAIEDWL